MHTRYWLSISLPALSCREDQEKSTGSVTAKTRRLIYYLACILDVVNLHQEYATQSLTFWWLTRLRHGVFQKSVPQVPQRGGIVQVTLSDCLNPITERKNV